MLASGSSERTAARATIEEAGAVLVRRRVEIPTGFIEQLYGRVVPEDVARYGPDDLATLAARAYDFMTERKPGAPKIRCETIELEHSADRNSVTVVEIVNDDMPFLVDSVMSEIAERKPEIRLVAHPVFGVRRTGTKLNAIDAPNAADTRESFIHIHLAPIPDDTCGELVRALQAVLGEVRLAVLDWRAMRERISANIAELKANPPPLPVDEIAETVQFLQWLLADNFTFLGLRDYNVDGQSLRPDFDGALGIMRSRELRVLKRGAELLEITPEIMAFLKEPRLLIIAKANIHSRVHRRVYLD
jgi:glutamate dehydrogenase